MISECEPRLAICARMAACAPCPIASMAITAATPMITPSMVRAERMVFRRKARWAMRIAMSTCVMVLPSKSARVGGVCVIDGDDDIIIHHILHHDRRRANLTHRTAHNLTWVGGHRKGYPLTNSQ